MEKGKTPDFLQMHSGELSEEKMAQFAENTREVKDYQVLHFLNIDNSTIVLGGHSLENSTQDNGLCVQSETFDYLVDLDNQIIEVKDGEIYVPVCYRQEYELQAGDKAEIAGENFVIAGFLRDSQMNSMMSSSKRFLVSTNDYERLKHAGSEEFLIEFMLQDGADYGSFGTKYTNAGLPANEPTITKPLIRMMNALSDGMMILVILLVSVILLLISILCIRLVLLAQLEEARSEIGMLKAIGIAKKDIRQIYFTKYCALSGVGMITGMFLAILLKEPLSMQIRELYGTSGNGNLEYLLAFVGVLFMEGIILLSIRHTCGYTEKLSAVEANEISLSSLCAEEYGVDVGDVMLLEAGENQWKYKITGIYSDITNGGKTAKAAWLPVKEPVMWSIFYVTLKEGVSKEHWIADYTAQLPGEGIHAKTVAIQSYVENTYGQTIRQVQKAATMTKAAALLVIFVVVILFTRLLVARDRNEISLRKAIGFTEKEIKKIYYYRYIPVILFGILIGILAGNVLGEKLAGLGLKSLGATSFHFIVDYKVVFIMIPVITIIIILCAIELGLREIKRIKPFECCVGKE